MELLVKSPDRTWRDDSGQWWYRFGRRGDRIRTSVQTCARCGREFVGCPIKRGGSQTPHCSRKCGVEASYAKQAHPMGWRGEKSRSWKGGTTKARGGYVMVHAPDHPSVQGTTRRYVRRCRLVMEQTLGRTLLPGEQVHHKNGIRDDDRPENLELWVIQQPAGARSDEQQHCKTCTCFSRWRET